MLWTSIRATSLHRIFYLCFFWVISKRDRIFKHLWKQQLCKDNNERDQQASFQYFWQGCQKSLKIWKEMGNHLGDGAQAWMKPNFEFGSVLPSTKNIDLLHALYDLWLVFEGAQYLSKVANFMANFSTRTENISPLLQNLFSVCRPSHKYANKMCSSFWISLLHSWQFTRPYFNLRGLIRIMTSMHEFKDGQDEFTTTSLHFSTPFCNFSGRTFSK